MTTEYRKDDKLTPADPAKEQIAPLTETEVPPIKERRGFLPFYANAFDRVFISIVLLIAIHLLWMRFLEPASISINIATVISIILAVIIIRWG